jgi:hypothetical protein
MSRRIACVAVFPWNVMGAGVISISKRDPSDRRPAITCLWGCAAPAGAAKIPASVSRSSGAARSRKLRPAQSSSRLQPNISIAAGFAKTTRPSLSATTPSRACSRRFL